MTAKEAMAEGTSGWSLALADVVDNHLFTRR